MNGKCLKVLIVGGYGMFGGRLARLLSNNSRVELLVAGRSKSKATAFCRSQTGPARLQPIVFDRDGDIDAQITATCPDVVVDASGPWQSYGARPYRLAQAAIRHGAHYIDIADGRDFVQGIGELDGDAQQQGVAVLSGASTCPALTAAVSRHLSAGMIRVHSISGGIAPSPYVPMGQSVIDAIAGYSGKPLTIWRDGLPDTAHALVSARDFTIAPPGSMPLPRMQFLLLDVPDLDVLKDHVAPTGSTWFGVSTRPSIFQRLHRWMAKGVRHGIMRSLSWLARPMQFVKNRLSWGEHRGGMFVRVVGENDAGQIEDRSWHLVAEGDLGPNVPVLAAAIVIRRMLDGLDPPAGARTAGGEFELRDFEPLFEELGIQRGTRTHPARDDEPLFRRILGDAWARLPDPVRSAHELSKRLELAGTGTVTAGSSILARMIAKIFGFPDTASNVEVRVSMREVDGVESWQRDFDGHRFSSSLCAGRGRADGLVIERFGPVAFGIALIVDGDRLRYSLRRWWLLGVPMPTFLLPEGDMYESVEHGRFRFYVDVRLPLAGHVVTYEGSLQPVR